jgi:hypothetical protein
MIFTLAPATGQAAQTTGEILTDTGNINVVLQWAPDQLNANTQSTLTLSFHDGFSGERIADDVNYNLRILDNNGSQVYSQTGLVAEGGTGTQTIDFPANENYRMEVEVTGIARDGQSIDQTRNGIARGIVVVSVWLTCDSSCRYRHQWCNNNPAAEVCKNSAGLGPLMNFFYDSLSEKLYREMPDTFIATNKVMLNIEQFEAGQSYVIAKVENRYGETVKINIQGGTQGIELQETLFNLKGRWPRFAYVMTTIKDTGEVLVRKLPVIGIKDWLLIYEDDLFLLAVKDAYDELDIRLID